MDPYKWLPPNQRPLLKKGAGQPAPVNSCDVIHEIKILNAFKT